MKYLSYLCFCLLLIPSMACNKKLKNQIKPEVMEVSDELLFDQSQVPYVVVAIKRTTCFGECPAYEAKFYSDGSVSYVGKAFVQKRGNHKASASLNQINSIVKKAYDIKYFLMEDQYPDPTVQIMDAPSTITSIVCRGQNKTISTKLGEPDKLKDLQNAIDDLLNSLTFVSVDPVK